MNKFFNFLLLFYNSFDIDEKDSILIHGNFKPLEGPFHGTYYSSFQVIPRNWTVVTLAKLHINFDKFLDEFKIRLLMNF